MITRSMHMDLRDDTAHVQILAGCRRPTQKFCLGNGGKCFQLCSLSKNSHLEHNIVDVFCILAFRWAGLKEEGQGPVTGKRHCRHFC